MITIQQRPIQMDRRTDRRHAIAIPRFALVHREVKTIKIAAELNKNYNENSKPKESAAFKW